MHDAAFRELGIAADYTALDVTPDELGAAVAEFRGARDFLGANVTVPHKSAVMRWLDEIDPTAAAIGAVNTIVRVGGVGGRLVGCNTDADGFLAALREVVNVRDVRSALLLGAGGSARAVAWTLATNGVAVTVLNRSADRAEALVRDVGAKLADEGARFAEGLSVCEPSQALTALAECDLLVNSTSVGMVGGPAADVSPAPGPLTVMRSGAVVCDLVYRPAVTPLLRQAMAAGLVSLNGVSMLVHQGAAAFTAWTGRAAPVAVMRRAADAALAAPG